MGLRARLLILAAAVGLPLLALQVVSLTQQRSQAIGLAEQQLLNVVDDAVSQQNNALDDIGILARVLALAPDVRKFGTPECHALLRGIDNEHPMVSAILVTDTNGIVRCNSKQPVPQPVDLSGRDWFREASSDDAPDVVTSNVLIGTASQMPTISVAAPILEAGEGSPRIGILAIGMRLDWFSDVATRQAALPDVAISILDVPSGQMITRLPGGIWSAPALAPAAIREAIRQHQHEAIAIPDAKGETRLYAMGMLPTNAQGNAALVIDVARQPVIATAMRHYRRQLALALLLTGAGLMGGWALARRTLIRPIAALAQSAERLRRGDMEARVPLSDMTTPEFAALADSLNAASWALELHNRRMQDLVLTDALTGVANRRRFDSVLPIEWRRGRRYAMPLSLVMIDADYFKQYNDRYGHQKGDEALRSVAAAMDSVLRRPGDFIARYGGEEFVVLMPATDAQGARAVAERMREALHALRIPHETNAGGLVTISIGIAATLPTPDQDPSMLLRAADLALYEAKSAGRDQVVIAPDFAPMVPEPSSASSEVA